MYYSIVRICCNLCICSSVDEDLDHFQFGPMANKAATSVVFYGPLLSFPLVKYLGIKWPGHREGVCLTSSKLISLLMV